MIKKVTFFATLALAAVSSWAFYPKAAETSGYMMLTTRSYPDYAVTTIASDGAVSTQVVDPKRYGSIDRTIMAQLELHKAELRKINELRQIGWRVTSTSVQPNGVSAAGDYVYLLEK